MCVNMHAIIYDLTFLCSKIVGQCLYEETTKANIYCIASRNDIKHTHTHVHYTSVHTLNPRYMYRCVGDMPYYE